MKKITLSALVTSLLLFNSHVFANSSGYIGLDLAVSNTTDLSISGASIDENNDLGFNLYSGQRFNISDGFDLGIELEYKNIGKADFGELYTEGDAIFINGRSKFTSDSSNPLYSGIILGLGYIDGKISDGSVTLSESDIAYQAGVEIGYMLNNFDISLGYRWQFSTIDEVDVTVDGFTAGLRYNF